MIRMNKYSQNDNITPWSLPDANETEQLDKNDSKRNKFQWRGTTQKTLPYMYELH